MLSAAIEIQAPSSTLESCVATILKVSTEVRNYFSEKKFTVQNVDYPEESDMLRSDMMGSTMLKTRFIAF